MNISLLFPGQGTQYVGMGKEFYAASPEAKAVFDQAEDVFGGGLLDVIFKGPQDKLTSTAFCQPAIVTASCAALAALKAHPKFKGLEIQSVAGLSLGEYSAIHASGALSFEDTLRLIQKRAQFMDEAAQINDGKMSAVIGLDKDTVARVCAEAGAEVANYNTPQQTVITGHAGNVAAAGKRLKDAGAKSVIPLTVAGAFHSSLMKQAENNFVRELAKMTFEDPEFPVICNVNGAPTINPDNLAENLAEQITSSVQWVDSVQSMVDQGVTTFIEVGPGKVLKGLLRKIDPAFEVHNVEKPEDLENLPF